MLGGAVDLGIMAALYAGGWGAWGGDSKLLGDTVYLAIRATLYAGRCGGVRQGALQVGGRCGGPGRYGPRCLGAAGWGCGREPCWGEAEAEGSKGGEAGQQRRAGLLEPCLRCPPCPAQVSWRHRAVRASWCPAFGVLDAATAAAPHPTP